MIAIQSSTALAPFGALVPGWKWRTREEGDVSPSDMRTSHLFYTLRMIWNHTMPAHMQVGDNIKRWSFGRRHPPEYMREAIRHLGAELFRRADLAPWQAAQLEQMAYWLTDEPRRLEARAPI